MKEKNYTLELAGKTWTATFSDLAEQAGGSVLMKCEDTVVLATVCMSGDGKDNRGFFNLTVEYMERFYASGLILGGQYNKREGRPSDKAVLVGRIIDRTIRPLFPHHIKNAVQVIVTVLSVGKMSPTVLAVNAVSLAIATSNIPWAGPVGCSQIGMDLGGTEMKVNNHVPYTGDPNLDLDLLVCGKDGEVVMIESSAAQKSEADMGSALDMAMDAISKLENWQKEIISSEGKTKLDMPAPDTDPAVVTLYEKEMEKTLLDGLFAKNSKAHMHECESKWEEMVEKLYDESDKKRNEKIMLAKDYLDGKINDLVHEAALKEDKRVDLRALDEVRPLFAKAGGLSSVVHGSGIFYRGETHVLSVATLGGPDTLLEIEGMEVRGTKRFMHYYNFPPYSTGETGRVGGGMNRREMGHGFLAEKALALVIPEKEKFPYTIRVVSESTSSNGSTSQGSICAATLALMDAGVPIKAPVAGIAMGVMIEIANSDKRTANSEMPKYKILTDIQGPEDHHGDMDFKVAGTENGVTALQLDIKVGGIPPQVLKEALTSARTAHKKILKVMLEAIPAPRPDISPSAPKILVLKIKPDQIGLVIGGGGKTVNMIRDKTGAEINIEDDGTVYVTGKNGAAEAAKKIIEAMTHDWKVGEVTEGLVMKILEIGAVVALSEYTDGLVHISEIAPFRVNKVTDVLKEGQRVPIKIMAVDHERGRISLSIKAADPNFIKPAPATTHTTTPPKA